MINRLRNFLRRWLGISPAAPINNPAQSARSFTETVERYGSLLDNLQSPAAKPKLLLSILLARNAVQSAQKQATTPEVDQVARLTELDQKLRRISPNLLESLPAWRRALSPPKSRWWWYLEEEAKEKDWIWNFLTGLLLLITTTLALEIIRRLWVGVPDMSAIFGTLLTALLTASPLTKQGRELATWLFKGLSKIKFLSGVKPRYWAEAMAAMALVAAVGMGLIWVFVRPAYATLMNNWGLAELSTGDVTAAEMYFRRAVALDQDQVVQYHNLAALYARTGRLEEAGQWYLQAIAHAGDFGPAYAGLSQLYNEEGQFKEATRIALVGLRPENQASEPEAALVARYNLLSNLGWAYFGQEQYRQAQEALEAALSLEPRVRTQEQETRTGLLRSPIPHFFLAQVYEQQEKFEEAQAQYRETKRFLDPENWAQHEWLNFVQEKLGAP